MDEDFLEKIDIARNYADAPFTINSGYRCVIHNDFVGSTSNNHTSGRAADIHVESDRDRFKMLKALISAGMTGIGIGKKYIHADTAHEVPTVWVY